MAKLLIVDDDPSLRAALAARFAAKGHEVETACGGAEGLEAARRGPDLMLLDLQMPEGDGFSVLRGLEERGQQTLVIVLTAHGTIEKAVEAMRRGAYDFLLKPFEVEALEASVERALERESLRRENRALRADSEARHTAFVGGASCVERVLTMARKAADSKATILLRGESGTGKEVLAREIHRWSDRASGPFIALNCSALNEGLLESELFGHEKGAFTGAHGQHRGKLELADGGTLFLDEIGDVSTAFQTRLLRVLEERSFERVGGSKTLQVDVRVLAATHRDLEALISEGTFREDLYYRLQVIPIVLPSLRERKSDLRDLVLHFLEEFSGEVGRPALSLGPGALAALEHHDWPGNVRELRNVIERAVVLAEGPELLPEDLPSDWSSPGTALDSGGFHAQVEAHRKSILAAALDACGGNQTRAAERLGLQRTYLARLVRKYGL